MTLRLTASLVSRCLKTNKFNPQIITSRSLEQWKRPYLISLYKRRIDQGPEPERPASAWLTWNYDSELYCFGKRLGEEFTETTLKMAFTNPSYVEKETENRKQHGLDISESTDFKLQDNQELADEGAKVIQEVLEKFLKDSFKLMPEEGIQAVLKYLSSDSMLFYISSNLGVKDLVLSREFPPSEETMSQTFRAVVGALNRDKGRERAEKFIKDFIAVELIGKMPDEIWNVADPMSLLVKELENRGMEEPESRLMWSTGSETILANYVVGIYSNKKLLGQGPGETIPTAEEMAVRDALRNLYQIQDKKSPMKFC